MILGRLIMLLDAHQHAVIRTKWLTKIFVAGDVLSFLMQSSGELKTQTLQHHPPIHAVIRSTLWTS